MLIYSRHAYQVWISYLFQSAKSYEGVGLDVGWTWTPDFQLVVANVTIKNVHRVRRG